MAKDLTILDAPRATLSLPQQLEWLSGSLATVQWPGEQVQCALPSKVTMSDRDKELATQHLAQIETALDPNRPDRMTCSRARLSLLTKMLLASSVGSGSDAAAEARVESYLDAVSDMPPWTIAQAVKRWHRGECGGLGFTPNYSFAPAPAHLRTICADELAAYAAVGDKLRRLLKAVPMAEATRTNVDLKQVVKTHSQFRGEQKPVGTSAPIGGHAARIAADLAKRREANEQRGKEAAE